MNNDTRCLFLKIFYMHSYPFFIDLSKFEYVQLIKLGVYVGHTKATLFYSAWMLVGFRGNLALLSLQKFVVMFRKGLHYISDSVSFHRPV